MLKHSHAMTYILQRTRGRHKHLLTRHHVNNIPLCGPWARVQWAIKITKTFYEPAVNLPGRLTLRSSDYSFSAKREGWRKILRQGFQFNPKHSNLENDSPVACLERSQRSDELSHKSASSRHDPA